MNSSSLRIPCLLAFVAAASLSGGACGGRTIGGGNSSSSSGGSSGSSSGGSTCGPLPECDSRTDCPASDGCNVCHCENGEWACGDVGCGGDDVQVEAGVCPSELPTNGTACGFSDLQCSYPPGGGCGVQCSCETGVWSCFPDPCVAPVCPSVEPPSGGGGVRPKGALPADTLCGSEGETCTYPTASGCDDVCVVHQQQLELHTRSRDLRWPSVPVYAAPGMYSTCSEVGIQCGYAIDAGCDEMECGCQSDGWYCLPNLCHDI